MKYFHSFFGHISFKSIFWPTGPSTIESSYRRTAHHGTAFCIVKPSTVCLFDVTRTLTIMLFKSTTDFGSKMIFGNGFILEEVMNVRKLLFVDTGPHVDLT